MILPETDTRSFPAITIQSKKKDKLNGIYNLCVAGNTETAKLSTSIFTGEAALEQAQQEIVTRIQQSNSYKLGHFLLSPYRLFKKWIR